MVKNVIEFINNISVNTQWTFRALAAIGFTPNVGLNGKIFTQNYGKKAKDSSAFVTDNANNVFGLKFVAMKNILKEGEPIGGFMLVQTALDYAPLNIVIPLAITSAIPADIDFPQDGHLRWRTSAPGIEGFLYGYLVHNDQALAVDPHTLGLDSKCVDIQTVFAAGRYNLSFLTEKGTVYAMQVKTENVITNGKLPKLQKLKDNVTALLTVPHKGEMIAFYGTADGIYFGNERIRGSEKLNIVSLVVDSENPRIFARTNDGRIFSIPVDGNFIPTTGKLIAINDTLRQDEQLFAGPGVKVDENMSALLAIQWEQQGNTFSYNERTIALPLPIDFPIERTPPRNPRLA